MDRTVERVRLRIEYLGLGVGETAARCGVPMKLFSRYLTGVAKRGLLPETFLKLCQVLAMTPNQAYGVEPLTGVDPDVPEAPCGRDDVRIQASLNALPPQELVVAAELLDALVRARARRGG